MKRTDVKSHCPINHTLETIGDPWSLLILRDIVFFGKHTFKEFFESSERITTSVLTDKLVSLEKNGILTKRTNPEDQRRLIYVLTEKGLDLIPTLLSMMQWGTSYDPESTGHRKKELVDRIKKEQSNLSKEVQDKVKAGGYIFDGK
jgi:DNA-binding HxlR family transcriptional regulator